MTGDSGRKFPYEWSLAEAGFAKDRGSVFSCFSCGGGSTMGYKLAGFDVVGCNEIDPRMMALYVANHNPRHSFLEPIQTFKNREDLPPELFVLDILDGSPPCSTFSIAGNREADWGKKKKFREGQAEQVLDTLFFDFTDLAARLRPKVVVAENVKGLLMGKAKAYAERVLEELRAAGYRPQLFLLNSARMGVPQKRERAFFVALRNDLAELLPEIALAFDEESIPFSEVYTPGCDRPLTAKQMECWESRIRGDIDFSASRARLGYNPNSYFNYKYLYGDKIPNTVTGHDCCVLFDEPRFRNKAEVLKCSSWPLDYDFGAEKPEYVCGMSVPPVMMAQVASAVWEQWLSKIS